MKIIIIQLISASLTAVAFALLFNAKSKYLFSCALGGLLNWGTYLIVFKFTNDIFIASFAASAVPAVYSEVAARIHKAPATIFFVTSIIPLVPGRSLYYTLSNIVSKNGDLARQNALLTAKYVVGIALGASAVWALNYIIARLAAKKRALKTPKTF